MTRRFGAVALAIAWGTFAACGTSLEGDVPATDDAATTDSGVDADTGVVGDAGADVEAGRFCESLATKPTLCADFDEGDPVDYNFESVRTTGSPSVDTTLAKSPPGSMKAPGGSFVGRYFPGDSRTLSLSFDVWLGGADGGPPLMEFGIVGRIIAGTAQCSFDLASAPKELEIQGPDGDGGRTDERHAFTRYPVGGAWKDVSMRLTDDDAGVTVKVDIAGGSAVDEVRTTCPDLKDGAYVQVGLLYEPPSGEVRIDNVVFNRE